MEKIITTIVPQLLSKLAKGRTYYTQKDLTDYGFPQFLIKRITFHLLRELSSEFNLPGEEWVNRDSDDLLSEWAELQRILKREIHLPAHLAEEVVEKSVRECVGMTINPRKVIPELLFEESVELDSNQLTERSTAITVNRFLVWSMIRYMEKKNRESLNITDVTRIIESIDHKIVESYHPLNWLSLVKPLYELSGSTVHSDLFRRFFEHKGKNHLAKEFDLIDDEIKESRFIEILSSPSSIHVEGYKDDQQSLFQDEINEEEIVAEEPNEDLIENQDEMIEDLSDNTPIYQTFREDSVEDDVDEWIENVAEEQVSEPEEDVDAELVSKPKEDVEEEQMSDLEEDVVAEHVSESEEDVAEELVSDLAEEDEEELVSDPDENVVAELVSESEDVAEEQVSESEEDVEEEQLLEQEGDVEDEMVSESDDDVAAEQISDLEEDIEEEQLLAPEEDVAEELVSDPDEDDVNVDIQDEELRAPWEEEVEDSFTFITHDDDDDDFEDFSISELKDLFNEEQESTDDVAEEQRSETEEDDEGEQEGVINEESEVSKRDEPASDAALLEIDDEDDVKDSEPTEKSKAINLEIDSETDADTDSDEEDSSLLNRFMFDDSDTEDFIDSVESDEENKVTTIYDELNLVRNDTGPETMDLFGSLGTPEIGKKSSRLKLDDKSSGSETEESETIQKFSDFEEPESEKDSDDSEVPMWRSFLEREENEAKSAFQFDDKSEEDDDEELDIEDSDEKLDEDGFIEEPIYDFTKKEVDLDEKIGDLSNWMKDVREKFIEDLFGDSEDAYEQALSDIMEFDDWKNASKYIEKEIFTRNRIDVYDEISVDFTDRLHSYFIENKS